jgi:TRAP-type C4-dicarboxylate transport system substrate-binding protein
MLLKSAKEAMDYQRSVVAQEDRDLPGLLSDQGMQIIRLSEEEIKQFKKMVLPVYEEFTPLIGKELVTLCIDEVKRTD